jgi:hypothetical protein
MGFDPISVTYFKPDDYQLRRVRGEADIIYYLINSQDFIYLLPCYSTARKQENNRADPKY